MLCVVINYFGPTMYKSLGLNASQSLLVQGIYGAVGPITNLLCVLIQLPREILSHSGIFQLHPLRH